MTVFTTPLRRNQSTIARNRIPAWDAPRFIPEHQLNINTHQDSLPFSSLIAIDYHPEVLKAGTRLQVTTADDQHLWDLLKHTQVHNPVTGHSQDCFATLAIRIELRERQITRAIVERDRLTVHGFQAIATTLLHDHYGLELSDTPLCGDAVVVDCLAAGDRAWQVIAEHANRVDLQRIDHPTITSPNAITLKDEENAIIKLAFQLQNQLRTDSAIPTKE